MTSRLKSVMAPRNHRRNPSENRTTSPLQKENLKLQMRVGPGQDLFLPPDHPHAQHHVQDSSKFQGNGPSSPKKSIEVYEDDGKSLGLHKKTKSSVSLKSLLGTDVLKSPKPGSTEKQATRKPAKSKSSTSLSALLSRPKSSKGSSADDVDGPKDKENQTPPTTGDFAPPPIWAQFSTRPIEGFDGLMKVPLKDVNSVADEVALYTPQEYSPSKQRNFGGCERPSLSRGIGNKTRQEPAALTHTSSSSSFSGTLSRLRKRSQDKDRNLAPAYDQPARSTRQESRRSSIEKSILGRRTSLDQKKKSGDSSELHPKGGSRVMAAVAVFNDISEKPANDLTPISKISDAPADPAAINHAFEELLESRNIPHNVRDKMRSLNTTIKADFIKKETSITKISPSVDAFAQEDVKVDTRKGPKSWHQSLTDDGPDRARPGGDAATSDTESPKKSRPRSLTFTRSKGDNRPKKQRAVSHSRTKSSDCTSSKSLTSGSSTQALPFLSRTPKVALPEDYISYLQKVQQPQVVEAGRIQKLRQLLRNETVSWVDTFVEKEGMAATVGLLYRIIGIEWREEHEDTLLHETLLCLKALCTTSSALQQLADIQATLFPALLGMLFDKERKGPSEFTTRSIVISLLFTYLSTSPPDCMEARAQTILSYLRDPSKPEEAQPPGFITSIYQPRPYRTWCNEIVSVTKEVFWIFLHHMNIVPYPSGLNEAASYATRHFPCERPPVPAAPYIGGVEWDATNYLATHMDLLNGLIASLQTVEERNALRRELKDSGFEKCMGVSLRTCKVKFYGAVHAGLTTWIGAAREDGWDVKSVKECPPQKGTVKTPSPGKKKHDKPPKLDVPKLDLGVVGAGKKSALDDGGWL